MPDFLHIPCAKNGSLTLTIIIDMDNMGSKDKKHEMVQFHETTKQQQIIVNDIVIDVIKKDINNIHLSVPPPAHTGRECISAPHAIAIKDEVVHLFDVSKSHWIRQSRHS